MINEFLTNPAIQLENSRVLLLPFTKLNAEKLRPFIFNEAVWMFMGMFVKTEQDFENYITDTLQQQGKTAYAFLVVDKLTNQVAGTTRYGNINFNSQKLEIGWTWYGTTFQGTGLNKACKFELLKYGFEHIGVRRIQFSADLENKISQKAIEKLGATKEGIFRNNYIDSKNNSKDDVYYSIIAADWPAIKNNIFTEYL